MNLFSVRIGTVAATLTLTLFMGVAATGGAAHGQSATLRVKDVDGMRRAVAQAKPGTHILLEPGEYAGSLYFSNLHGATGKPIVIGAADPAHPPHFQGGGSTLQFSDVTYLEVQDLRIERSRDNGLNIDDGGTYATPSHHVTLRNLHVSDLPQGNHDGIKLSGLDDFRVENCTVERWGGSGIDMVGCHRGVIARCTFRTGGDSGIQCKGGTSDMALVACRFENYGERGVNAGGSTGLPYFRPPIEGIPSSRRYEAKNIRVEGCTFVGGVAPIAFVGVDGATIRMNTFYHPERWALRILQETSTPDFVPSRNGVFEDNLVVFRSDHWFEGGVNIGPGTAPQTFQFRHNLWFCSDRPERSRPTLPTPEQDGIIGRDPLLRDPRGGDFGVRSGSPARGMGAHAYSSRPPEAGK